MGRKKVNEVRLGWRRNIEGREEGEKEEEESKEKGEKRGK